jgi:uncharacterized protein YkwD
MRRLAALLIGSVMTVGVLASTTTGASAASSADRKESSIVKLTNKDRVKHDARKVTSSKCLDKFAERQAKRQAKKKKMYHQNLQAALVECDMRMVGENVAFGFTSTKALQRAWMNSPGHRSNILNKEFRKVGVGAAKDSRGRWYYATVFGVSA